MAHQNTDEGRRRSDAAKRASRLSAANRHCDKCDRKAALGAEHSDEILRARKCRYCGWTRVWLKAEQRIVWEPPPGSAPCLAVIEKQCAPCANGVHAKCDYTSCPCHGRA